MMTIERDGLIGQKIGRYRVDARLGRGRGATVYSASDPVIGRAVAIKILDRPAAGEREAGERFLRDAAQLARLRHPQILPIYDYGEYEGRAYLVRQHTDGGTLRDYLREVGVLDLDAALALLRPIATGLDYAHRQGFVHGNLRPSNIVRTKGGKIYLTDFTVPGAGDAVSVASTIVSAIDDPAYVSPEIARNQPAAASADHYVLGVIFYEVLAGQPPFQVAGEGDTARHVLTRHLQTEPPSPRIFNPALGPAIEAVLLRALAKRPDERYPTGAALVYALSEAHALDREPAGAERRAARPVTGPLGRARPVTGELRAGSGLAVETAPANEAAPVVTLDELSPMAESEVSPPAEEELAIVEVAPHAAIEAEAPLPLALPAEPALAQVAPSAGQAGIPMQWQMTIIGIIALILGLTCGLLLAIW